MAKLIPPRHPASASASVLRMFRQFKRLGDDFTVWHQTMRRADPDFLVIWRNSYAFLVQVADTTQQLVEAALQPLLLADDAGMTPDQLAASKISAFRSVLLDPSLRHLKVRCLVVFPNVDQSTIDQVEKMRCDDSGVAFLGLKQTPEEMFERYLVAIAAAPLPEPALLGLRKRFAPESVIRESPARVPLLRRRGGHDLPPAFLALDQESLAKLDVELPPEAARAVSGAETRLVTGPAGSGKSLVLLHRALIAARLNRSSNLLILTHNRPINKELRRRAIATTAPEGSRIRWFTFFQWADRCLNGRPKRILSAREVESRLAGFKREDTRLAPFTAAFLAEELGYVRDLGIDGPEGYLLLERTGRLTGLTQERRQAIWALLERYRAHLAEREESDWHERALEFGRFAGVFPHRLPKYDFIFIDEAQFFAKVWFAPVLEALAPGGQLFLAADPTQGFLKRSQSWMAAGVDVRGRTSRLSKPYRSTRAILECAARFLRERSARYPENFVDDLDPPTAKEIAMVEEIGEMPVFIQAASNQDAIALAAGEVERLRGQAPWLAGSVLLLHGDSFAAADLVSTLRRRLGAEQVVDLNSRRETPPAQPFCGVSNLKSATGLEAAVVFVLGLDGLIERESDPRLDENERAELTADNTRLLYMACTRAGRRLVEVGRHRHLSAQ